MVGPENVFYGPFTGTRTEGDPLEVEGLGGVNGGQLGKEIFNKINNFKRRGIILVGVTGLLLATLGCVSVSYSTPQGAPRWGEIRLTSVAATATAEAPLIQTAVAPLTPENRNGANSLCGKVDNDKGVLSVLRKAAGGELPVCLDGTHNCQNVTIRRVMEDGEYRIIYTSSFEEAMENNPSVQPGDEVCLEVAPGPNSEGWGVWQPGGGTPTPTP